MNKSRRMDIQRIISMVHKLQIEMESMIEEVERVRDEESERFENIPENLQSSERYEIAEAAVENLESACDSFDVARTSLNEVVSSLEEASV